MKSGCTDCLEHHLFTAFKNVKFQGSVTDKAATKKKKKVSRERIKQPKRLLRVQSRLKESIQHVVTIQPNLGLVER